MSALADRVDSRSTRACSRRGPRRASRRTRRRTSCCRPGSRAGCPGTISGRRRRGARARSATPIRTTRPDRGRRVRRMEELVGDQSAPSRRAIEDEQFGRHVRDDDLRRDGALVVGRRRLRPTLVRRAHGGDLARGAAQADRLDDDRGRARREIDRRLGSRRRSGRSRVRARTSRATDAPLLSDGRHRATTTAAAGSDVETLRSQRVMAASRLRTRRLSRRAASPDGF